MSVYNHIRQLVVQEFLLRSDFSGKRQKYTGKHFPKHPGTRPPHARLDRMKTRLRAKNTFAN